MTSERKERRAVRRVGSALGVEPYGGCAFRCVFCPEGGGPDCSGSGGGGSEGCSPRREAARQLARCLAWGEEGPAAGLAGDSGAVIRIGGGTRIGGGGEPYPPVERSERATRACLEVLRDQPLLPVEIRTRSDLVVRDLPLLAEMDVRGVTIGLATVDPGLARRLEPGAPGPRARLSVLRRLRAAGVPAGVALSPVIPGITDRLGVVERTVRAAARAGAQWLTCAPLELPSGVRRGFFRFLGEEHPELRERYFARYGESAEPPDGWWRRVRAMIEGLRVDAGLASGPQRDHRPRSQLRLPFEIGRVGNGYAVGSGGRAAGPAAGRAAALAS